MDMNPSSTYHSDAVREINKAMLAQFADGGPQTDLSEEGLLATARKETGLHDFGDLSFLPALRILLKSLNTEADLSPYGRLHAHGCIVGSLKNRLWADDCFNKFPEIRKRKIVAPLIIIGPHRSGTTRLQRMIACDTRFRHLTTWEGVNPSPRLVPWEGCDPASDTGPADMGRNARYQEAKKAFIALQPMYPAAFDAHPMDADWPEEEMMLLNHSFCSHSFMGNFAIPGFYDWYSQADLTDGYRYMADLMRLISWSRGDPEDKPWLLKDPEHMLRLDVLMRVFPDAKVVFSYRDPSSTVASIMSLMWLFARQHTEGACRDRIRDVWLRFCVDAAERCLKQREIIPPEQRIDVLYEDVNKDWKAVMRRIYQLAGLSFGGNAAKICEAEQAMERWLKASEEENRHANHTYSLEDFGLNDQVIDERMGFVRTFMAGLKKAG